MSPRTLAVHLGRAQARSAPAWGAALLAILLGGCGNDTSESGWSLDRGTLSEEAARTGLRPEHLPPSAAPAPTPTRDTIDLAALGFDLGESGASIRVVEFSDFGCGYCRRFHEQVFPRIVEEYVEAGKVEWKYLPYILGIFPNALDAAIAGECAGAQERFFEMADLIFSRQAEWARASEPHPVFQRYATEVGLEADEYGRCVAERGPLSRIQDGTLLGRRLGINSTPTFYIVGVGGIRGAVGIEVWRQIFDDLLAGRPIIVSPQAGPSSGGGAAGRDTTGGGGGSDTTPDGGAPNKGAPDAPLPRFP